MHFFKLKRKLWAVWHKSCINILILQLLIDNCSLLVKSILLIFYTQDVNMGMGFSKDSGSWSDNRKNTRFSQKDIIRKQISRTTISRIADKNKDADLQLEINSDAQRREVWLIHDKLEGDIKEFLKSDDSKPSDDKPYLHVVGNKILELLSEEKYPEYKQKLNEDGKPMYDKMTKQPLEAYQAANHLSIPRYFKTTEGTWSTISQHINSQLTRTSQESLEPNTYSPENVKEFLNSLGNFVLDKIDADKKTELFKDVPEGSSVAEHYRHCLDLQASETVEKTQLRRTTSLGR